MIGNRYRHNWLRFTSLAAVVALGMGCAFSYKTQPVPADELVFAPGEYSITFIGHATLLIHLNDVNILTDPNFNNWSTILRRSREAGMKIQNLPPIDAILISHPHYDHLDKSTLEQLPKDIPIAISKGNGKLLSAWGFKNVKELNPWDTLAIKDAAIIAVPAKHSGSRNSPWINPLKALGYIVQREKTIYFAGDTGLSEEFRKIGKSVRIDIALLPIGAYRPRWFMRNHHMGPEDALEAMTLLSTSEMIPIHWGSFRMALDGLDESKKVLLDLIRGSRFEEKIHVLENGEKYRLKWNTGD